MVKYYSFDTKIGKLVLYFDKGNVLAISFSDERMEKYIGRYYGDMLEVDKGDYSYHEEIIKYISGDLKEFTIPFKLSGTEFQLKVWNELANIPYGETRTYKEVAENIGCEKGYRAVGGALNKNPISIVVPCHRVIGSNGSLTGFAGGLSRKEKLLMLEKSNV